MWECSFRHIDVSIFEAFWPSVREKSLPFALRETSLTKSFLGCPMLELVVLNIIQHFCWGKGWWGGGGGDGKKINLLPLLRNWRTARSLPLAACYCGIGQGLNACLLFAVIFTCTIFLPWITDSIGLLTSLYCTRPTSSCVTPGFSQTSARIPFPQQG